MCKDPTRKIYFLLAGLTFFFVWGSSFFLLQQLCKVLEDERQIRAEATRGTTQFAFTIPDIVTDHQFKGQIISFSILYQYRDNLSDAGFSPKGKEVAVSVYPYFQIIRKDLIQYVKNYPSKTDFYETFGRNSALYLLNKYPQLSWIQIKVDVPAYGGVDVPRAVIIKLYNTK